MICFYHIIMTTCVTETFWTLVCHVRGHNLAKKICTHINITYVPVRMSDIEYRHV